MVAATRAPRFGSVEWQDMMLARIEYKKASGEKLNDEDEVFLEVQAIHNKSIMEGF